MKVLLDGTAVFSGSLIMDMDKTLTRDDITRIEQTVARGVEEILSREFHKQLKVTGVIIGNVREVKSTSGMTKPQEEI